MKKMLLIPLSLLTFNVYAETEFSKLKNTLSFEYLRENRVYEYDAKQLLGEVLKVSPDVQAALSRLEASQDEKMAADWYFLPNLTLSNESKFYMPRPGAPERGIEHNLSLSSELRLWGSGLTDELDAAQLDLVAANYQLSSAVISSYYESLKNIEKIEFAHQFLNKSKFYDSKIQQLISLMEKHVDSGLVKKSDLLFASVTTQKFKEKMLGVESKIQEYIKNINTVAGRKVYSPQYGMAIGELDTSTLEELRILLNEHNIVSTNFELLNSLNSLEAERKRAFAQNEMFELKLVTEQNARFNDQTNIADETSGQVDYAYDPDNDSYVGLSFTIKGLDFTAHKRKDSATNEVVAKQYEHEKLVSDKLNQLESLSVQLETESRKKVNLEKQISLTYEIVERQFEEIAIEEANISDILRNISSITDLEGLLLTSNNTLIDVKNTIYELKGELPDEIEAFDN
ncbi:TolC family protein [Vibrio coralliilyticus]|uniref:TolC family protein n=1 Tax=Vibrio coralliilyticus TaxID=190893 RepID=UPI0017B7CE14|nr:TolC family protein [Vibrio coralliilyticus]NUW70137.1 TolC family protein [Vibrio coralliilyticus]